MLRLDAAPTAASVERDAGFAIDGVTERVGVRIVDGDERAQILRRWDVPQDDRSALVIAARRRFPDGAAVRLLWGAGIATADGAATTEDQTLEFTVREPLHAPRCAASARTRARAASR